jgi:CheY-like chemotaxis protein
MIVVGPVLLAEDEEFDVVLMQRAFRRAEVRNDLIVVRDGREAVAYLEGQGKYAQRQDYPEPYLLLLDLKLPVMDGFEVLEWIQERPRWRDGLPVIVLTGSGQESDRKRALDLGAHGYLIKPTDADGLVGMVASLKTRFLDPQGAPAPRHEEAPLRHRRPA